MAERLSTLAATYVTVRTRRREFNGATPATVRSILWNFASACGDPPANRLTRDHVETWLTSMDVAASTARNRLSTVRAFCAWLQRERQLRANPCDGLKGPRQPRAVPRALLTEQVSLLYDHLPDVRAELIASLMVQEGLRCLEVANLEVGDVDEVNRTIVVVGKGGHQRMLPLSDETWGALRDYLNRYPTTAGPLVRSYAHPNRGLSPGYISSRVRKWMAEAGVKQRPRDRVAAHSLRHTAATDVLRKTGNVRLVQQMLGHTSLSSTQVYLRTYPQELREAMAGRSYKRPDADVARLR